MTLHDLNIMEEEERSEKLYNCCGSSQWVALMQKCFPFEDLIELLDTAEQNWNQCSEEDWREAFSQHPKIDEPVLSGNPGDLAWAADEQRGLQNADENTREELISANKFYEERFGFIFILSASEKTAEEMLSLIRSRIENLPGEEIKLAADEQLKIMKNRIKKLLA